jgi:hypothetical protein
MWQMPRDLVRRSLTTCALVLCHHHHPLAASVSWRGSAEPRFAASLQELRHAVRSFDRFDEILYIVDKESDLTLGVDRLWFALHYRQFDVRGALTGVMNRIVGNHARALAFVRSARIQVAHKFWKVG